MSSKTNMTYLCAEDKEEKDITQAVWADNGKRFLHVKNPGVVWNQEQGLHQSNSRKVRPAQARSILSGDHPRRKDKVMRTRVSEVIKQLQGRPIEAELEKVFSLPRDADGIYWNLQGGGSDGSFAYFVMVSKGPSETALSRIFKVSLESWELVKVSGMLSMNHANDLVCDSARGRLVVSHCDVHPEKVSFIDPESLELIGTRDIPQRHYSLAFDAEKGLYVAGKSRTYDLVLLDEDFTPVRELPGVEGFVKQGLDCDEDFIYFFQTGPDLNWIFVFDWDGAPISRIKVPMVGESENLFTYGDGFVGAFNNNEGRSADVYMMRLKEGCEG